MTRQVQRCNKGCTLCRAVNVLIQRGIPVRTSCPFEGRQFYRPHFHSSQHFIVPIVDSESGRDRSAISWIANATRKRKEGRRWRAALKKIVPVSPDAINQRREQQIVAFLSLPFHQIPDRSCHIKCALHVEAASGIHVIARAESG